MKLGEFLRDRRDILRKIEVQSPGYSDSFGYHEGGTETVEVIDFDALCNAIDEFGEQVRKEAQHAA